MELEEKEMDATKKVKCPICGDDFVFIDKKTGYIVECSNCENVRLDVRGL